MKQISPLWMQLYEPTTSHLSFFVFHNIYPSHLAVGLKMSHCTHTWQSRWQSNEYRQRCTRKQHDLTSSDNITRQQHASSKPEKSSKNWGKTTAARLFALQRHADFHPAVACLNADDNADGATAGAKRLHTNTRIKMCNKRNNACENEDLDKNNLPFLRMPLLLQLPWLKNELPASIACAQFMSVTGPNTRWWKLSSTNLSQRMHRWCPVEADCTCVACTRVFVLQQFSWWQTNFYALYTARHTSLKGGLESNVKGPSQLARNSVCKRLM